MESQPWNRNMGDHNVGDQNMTGTGRLAGQVAVVTGAGNGIGRACALRFAEEGAAVVCADVQQVAAEATAELVTSAGGQSAAISGDAASRVDNDAMAQLAVDRFGRLDVLLTAAGISHADYRSGDSESEMKYAMRSAEFMDKPWLRFLDYDTDSWQRVMDVNLTGTFLAMQACVARMQELGNGGRIVTIASIAAKDPDAGPLPYTVSKAGVWMLTKKSARDLAGIGIRVNAIGPGFIETNMTALIQMMPPDRIAELNRKIPLGRTGQPREIANVALFLASDESSYMTGEILHPDGGWYTE
jgi:NAD(P)-dependent dehydrogenase (short-subunit alcohol dehydrogenase family)